MAMKTANVMARIEPEIKASAEAILEDLGIPVSVFIDMTYRQVIAKKGVPFSVNLPNKMIYRDELSEEQFDSIMEKGLIQAEQNETKSVKDVFEELRKRV